MTSEVRNRIMQFTTQPVAHNVPDLGQVYLRRLTLGELTTMQNENAATPTDKDKAITPTMRLLARFLGDDKGAPVFDLAKPEDVVAMQAVPVSVAANILRAGNRLNNMEEKENEKNA